MKRLLIVLLVATVTLARADDSKISPELRGYKSTQQVQVIVQYAPGTQVNCSGLFGFIGCLVNDILKLGGAILGQLPLINGVVALLDGNGIVSLSNQSLSSGWPGSCANAGEQSNRKIRTFRIITVDRLPSFKGYASNADAAPFFGSMFTG